MKILLLFLVAPLFVFGQPAPAAAANSAKPKVLIVSAEMKGAFQTGGLGHATADLAASMGRDYSVEVLLPRYLKMADVGAVDSGKKEAVSVDWYNGHSYKMSNFSLWNANVHGVKTTLFAHDSKDGAGNYFDNLKDGKYPSLSGGILEGEGWAALARAQSDYILKSGADVVVLNDWTTGLVALYLREAAERGEKIPKIVFAIHNIRYQGLYGGELSKWMGIDAKHWHIDGIQHGNGTWSMFKAGLMYSDMVYTVSESYAQEIKDPRLGMGMEGIIQLKEKQNRMTGILNGIVNEEWDPRHKREGLPFEFSENDWSGKAQGKALVQRELGLSEMSDTTLIAMTSRIDEQKGFTYILPAIETLLASGKNVQFAITGDPVQGDAQSMGFWKTLEELSTAYPDKIQVRRFSPALEKKFLAYSDFFHNGAWFEPCGLNQFFALRTGTLALVSNVGGLKDSIHDGTNGFKFEVVPGANGANYDVAATSANALTMLNRAIDLHQNHRATFDRMRTHAIMEDHSWSSRINKYYDVLMDYVLTSGWNKAPISYARAEVVNPTVNVTNKAPAVRVRTEAPRAIPGQPSNGRFASCRSIFTS